MRPTSVILVLSLLAGGAHAQTAASAANPQSIADQFEMLGYDARLDPYESGRPRIRSAILGVNYSVAFYGCLDDMTDCQGLMFTAGFDMSDPSTWQFANGWNETRVYSRAFLDEDSDPYVQMPVPVASSLSHEDMRRLVDIWETEVIKFTDQIGFERSEESASESAPESDPVASAQPTAPASATPESSVRVGPKKAPSASSLGAQDR